MTTSGGHADSLHSAYGTHLLGHDAGIGPRWRRRLVTLPSYFVACALASALAPLLLAVTGLWDLARGARFATTRGVLAVLAYLLAEGVGVLASFVLWLRHRPGDARWDRAHVLLQRRWARFLFRALERLYGLDVHVEDDGAPEGPSLCLVRHASLADTLIPVVHLAARWDLAPRYVLKRELLNDPCLDIVGQRIANAFITRRADRAGEDARAIELLASDLPNDGTLVLYPEGTRFTPAKRDLRLRELAAERRERLAELKNVLPPRPRGALAALAARPDLRVSIVAHTGLEPLRSIGALFDGSLIGRRFDVAIWCLSDVPHETEAFTQWIDAQWQRMDAWVSR